LAGGKRPELHKINPFAECSLANHSCPVCNAHLGFSA
jgi:hypothetical protein